MATEPQPIQIPEAHLDAFGCVESMSDEDFGGLVEALASVQFPTSYTEIVDSVAADVGLHASELVDVVEAAVSLCGYGTQLGQLSETIARRVAVAEQVTDDPERKPAFEQRVIALLQSRAIRLLSKTLLIGGRHPNVFRKAQILTDVRPMFDLDIETNPDPEGALLTHTLMITYVTSSGDSDNFYVAMDDMDLANLVRAVKRAVLKSDSLQAGLARFGIPQVLTE